MNYQGIDSDSDNASAVTTSSTRRTHDCTCHDMSNGTYYVTNDYAFRNTNEHTYNHSNNSDFLALDPHDNVDMSVAPRVLESPVKYQGKVFRVEDRLVELTTTDKEKLTIHRQVMVHNPCVVMLVHDSERDLYLVEREYRVGPNAYVYGLPAGIMEDGEDPHTAALRELREETGIVAAPMSSAEATDNIEPCDTEDDNAATDNAEIDTTPDKATVNDAIVIDDVAQTYSSEGMSNEIANIMVLHLKHFTTTDRQPDADEHVHSGWVTWDELNHVGIVASNATIAIQHERYRRAMQRLAVN